MKKNYLRAGAVLGILFAVFSVIVFAVLSARNGVFFLSYFFTVVALGVQGYALHLAFGTEDTATSKFYGFPVARVGFLYLVAQVLFSLLCMILAEIMPLWITIVVDVVFLGAALVGLITSQAIREEIQNQDQILKKDVALMRGLQSKCRVLVGRCEDGERKAQLAALSEALQYSDPISSPAIMEVEYQLSQLMDELEKAVVEEEYAAAQSLCAQAMQTLSERNRLCKLNKGR